MRCGEFENVKRRKKPSPPKNTGRVVVGGDIRRMEASLVSVRTPQCGRAIVSFYPIRILGWRFPSSATIPIACDHRHSAKPGPNPATSSRPPRPFNQQLKQKPNSGGECGIIESSLDPRDSIPHIRRVPAVHFFFSVASRSRPSPRPMIRSRPNCEARKRHSSRDRKLSVSNLIDPPRPNRFCPFG